MNTEKMDFGKYASTWDESPGRVKLAGELAAAVKDSLSLTPDMDILDFGCGTGLVTLQLASSVRSVTAVDSSRGMLDTLESRIAEKGITNVKTLYVDLDEGHKLDGEYHLVLSSMTLHHIKEIRPVLEMFHAVLKRSGSVCLSDLDPEGGRFHSDNQGVFHFGFDREKIRDLLMEAGFNNVEDRTAATVVKPAPEGEESAFTVFLITAKKVS
jgi:ubiquinone/menaquinone biosynthesis C-methylase UbiE